MKAALGAAAMLACLPARAIDLGGEHDLCAGSAHCRVASEAELAALRGGFEVSTPGGRLRIDIGITRSVSINDRLAAVSQLMENQKVLIVQNGPGNFAPPQAFHAGAMPTIIQNSLDNQTIRTVTLVNATVNSLSVMNGIRFAQMLGRATAASGR